LLQTPPNDPQRIWWCLTGPLAFLPIHAAGLYGEDDGFGSKLSDFVISSYTPSLTALIEAFRGGPDSKPLQLLAVAQPSAHSQHYIPGTKRRSTIFNNWLRRRAHQFLFFDSKEMRRRLTMFEME
jgi:hypothetical protein